MDELPFLREAMERMDAGDTDEAISCLDRLYQAAWRSEEEVSMLAHALAVGIMLHETDQEIHEIALSSPPNLFMQTLREWCAHYVSERSRHGRNASVSAADYLAWGRAMAEDGFAMAGWVVDMEQMPLLDFLMQAMILETARNQGRLMDVTEVRSQAGQLQKAFQELATGSGN